MKNLSKQQPNKKYFYTLLTIIFTIILTVGFFKVASWFDTHTIHKQRILSMTWKLPIEIQKREPQIIEKQIVLDYPDEIDTDLEKYICEKFGVYDCKTALAIAKAESGLREDAINVNSDGSIDLGIFQINSVHYKKAGCLLKDVVDAFKNVDCGYQIFEAQGFGPWVVYQNGNYLAKMGED